MRTAQGAESKKQSCVDRELLVEQWPLERLRPYEHNPRKNDPAVPKMVAAIQEFGFRIPIVARSDGQVVDGHLRLKAAVALQLSTVPVALADNLSDAQIRAFRLLANRSSSWAEWDEDLLAIELATLRDEEFDLDLTGFGEEELDELLALADSALDDDPADEEAPDPPTIPTSRLGDLWLLGAHRLLCGDSTSSRDVARVLADDMPRLLLTDPPYGVELDMEWRDRAGLNALGPAESSYMRRGAGHKNTAISGDTKADWSDAFELVPSLDTAYVWHASAFAVEVGQGLRRIGFEIKQQIIWRKPHFALSRQHYHWQHEPCWYARKTGSGKFRGSRDQSTIWEAASPKMLMNPAGDREEKVDHPTQKPLALYTRPIENHLPRGGCFYEPFGGSGTAICAAEKTGRRCIAIELDPRFVDVIVLRWERLTGKSAVLSGSDCTFADVARERGVSLDDVEDDGDAEILVPELAP